MVHLAGETEDLWVGERPLAEVRVDLVLLVDALEGWSVATARHSHLLISGSQSIHEGVGLPVWARIHSFLRRRGMLVQAWVPVQGVVCGRMGVGRACGVGVGLQVGRQLRGTRG